jgi:hypothetical protein
MYGGVEIKLNAFLTSALEIAVWCFVHFSPGAHFIDTAWYLSQYSG